MLALSGIPMEKPCACCDFADCELYPGDLCYFVDGLIVCEDCFTPFVRHWLASCRREAGEEGLRCLP